MQNKLDENQKEKNNLENKIALLSSEIERMK